MMEEKHNGIYCEKGDVVRIKGLSETVNVVFLDASGNSVSNYKGGAK